MRTTECFTCRGPRSKISILEFQRDVPIDGACFRWLVATAFDGWIRIGGLWQTSVCRTHTTRWIDADMRPTGPLQRRIRLKEMLRSALLSHLLLPWRQSTRAIQASLTRGRTEIARTTAQQRSRLLVWVSSDVMVVGITPKYAAARWPYPHGILLWVAAKIDTRTAACSVAEATRLIKANITGAGSCAKPPAAPTQGEWKHDKDPASLHHKTRTLHAFLTFHCLNFAPVQ